MFQAYAGKVRTDIDHNSYKPAAWRVDSYLDASDDEQDVIESLRSHKLVFSKDTARNDHMARQEKLDDYSVSLCLLHTSLQSSCVFVGFADDGPGSDALLQHV